MEHALYGGVGQLAGLRGLQALLLHQVHDFGEGIQAALEGALPGGAGQQGAGHSHRGRQHHPHPVPREETGHEAP